MTPIIDSFRGEHRFLSNFYPTPTPYRGVVFPASEHAYAAAKTSDPVAFQRVATASTPGEAKELGRGVELIPDWETVKFDAMWQILWAKFTYSTALRNKLLATRGSLLVEGNDWHDQTWGSCVCQRHVSVPGGNALGVMLKALRLRLDIGR